MLIFLEVNVAIKKELMGTFDLTGWAGTPGDKLKTILKSYRASNADEGIVYKAVKSLAKTYQLANHDPVLYAELVKRDLTVILNDVFEYSNVTCTSIEGDDGRYTISIGVNIRADNKQYDLYSVLKSEGKSLFEDFDRSYFEHQF